MKYPKCFGLQISKFIDIFVLKKKWFLSREKMTVKLFELVLPIFSDLDSSSLKYPLFANMFVS